MAKSKKATKNPGKDAEPVEDATQMGQNSMAKNLKDLENFPKDLLEEM